MSIFTPESLSKFYINFLSSGSFLEVVVVIAAVVDRIHTRTRTQQISSGDSTHARQSDQITQAVYLPHEQHEAGLLEVVVVGVVDR